MTRPVCAIGLSYLVCMAAAAFMSRELCVALAALFLLAAVTAYFALPRKRKAALCALIAAAAAFAVMGAYLSLYFYPRTALDGLTADIAGTVTDIDAGRGRTRYSVTTDAVGIDGAPQRIKLVLTGYGDYDLELGDRVSCQAKLYAIGEETALEERMYLRSGGVALFAIMSGEPAVERADGRSLPVLVAEMRERLRESAVRLLPGWRGGMLAAMVMGERGGLDPELKDAFRVAGMSHMLAISGMHLVAVAGTADALLSKAKVKRRARGFIMAAIAVLYVVAAGAGLSVLRAGFMLVIKYLAGALKKEYDTVSALAAAVIVVLLINPLAAVDPGFLMSVLGSFAIVALSAPFALWIERVVLHTVSPGRALDLLIQSVSVTVCAWCCTSPVAALTYGSLSLVSVPSNLLSAPFAFLTVGAGVPAVALASLGAWAPAQLLAYVAGFAETVMLTTAKLFAALPFATASFSRPWLTLWLLGAAALVVVPAAVKKSWRYLKYSVVLAAVTLLLGLLSSAVLMRGVTVVNVQPLSEGTAIACSKDGSTVLITDAMTADDTYAVRELVARAGGKLDAFVSLRGDSATELALAKLGGPKAAALSSPAAERYEGAAVSGEGRLVFWREGSGEASASFISEGVYGIEAGDLTILYISGDCDIMELPLKLRRADIALIAGEEPANMGALSCRWLLTDRRRAPFDGAGETLVMRADGLRFAARGENMVKG